MFEDIQAIISQRKDLASLDIHICSHNPNYVQAFRYIKHQLKKLAQQSPAFCIFENPMFDRFYPSLRGVTLRDRYQAMLECINTTGIIESGTSAMCIKNGDYDAVIFMLVNVKQSILILMDDVNYAFLVDDDLSKTFSEMGEVNHG